MIRRPAAAALASAALALGGCFSDRGLVVEIDLGDTNPARVELFLGMTACDPANNAARIDCRTIAPPPMGATPLRGEIWFRDSAISQVATVQGRRATFRLTSDTAAQVPVVIAVGTDNQMREVAMAMLRDVAIPSDTGRVLRTTLVPATSMMDPGPPGPVGLVDRVMVWGNTMPPQGPFAACAAVEHWEGGVLITRSFLVPADDPDCDNVARECAPAAFHGMANAGDAAPDCTTNQGDGCQLGSHGCTDDGGLRSGECVAQHSRTCVPESFCDCPMVDPSCLARQLQTQPTSHVECAFPVDDKLSLCPNDASAIIKLDGLLGDGANCEQPLIGDLALDRFATSAEFGGATLALSSPRAPCSFAITWKSGSRATNEPVGLGAIEVPVRGRAMMLPLVVRFDRPSLGGCVGSLTSMCQLMDAEDNVGACAE